MQCLHNTIVTGLSYFCYAPGVTLVLCCDWFDCDSKQVKCDLVDLVTEDYDITLCWEIRNAMAGPILSVLYVVIEV